MMSIFWTAVKGGRSLVSMSRGLGPQRGLSSNWIGRSSTSFPSTLFQPIPVPMMRIPKQAGLPSLSESDIDDSIPKPPKTKGYSSESRELLRLGGTLVCAYRNNHSQSKVLKEGLLMNSNMLRPRDRFSLNVTRVRCLRSDLVDLLGDLHQGKDETHRDTQEKTGRIIEVAKRVMASKSELLGYKQFADQVDLAHRILEAASPQSIMSLAKDISGTSTDSEYFKESRPIAFSLVVDPEMLRFTRRTHSARLMHISGSQLVSPKEVVDEDGDGRRDVLVQPGDTAVITYDSVSPDHVDEDHLVQELASNGPAEELLGSIFGTGGSSKVVETVVHNIMREYGQLPLLILFHRHK